MTEININNKTYQLTYSLWSILKAEEASGMTIEQWSDGTIKSLVTLVYAGVVDSGISFEAVARALPLNQDMLKPIAEKCSVELAQAMGTKAKEEAK